jgi:hypothetical protein
MFKKYQRRITIGIKVYNLFPASPYLKTLADFLFRVASPLIMTSTRSKRFINNTIFYLIF